MPNLQQSQYPQASAEYSIHKSTYMYICFAKFVLVQYVRLIFIPFNYAYTN